jgi:RNA polymerase sigma-70 factor (ECF subfamily)
MADPEDLRHSLVGILPDLRAYARFLLRDPVRADDLVQETALRALSASAQYQPGTSLKAWAFTIQRNLFLEQGRRRKREENALNQQAGAAEAMVDNKVPELSELSRLLWALPPALREALVLVGAEELTHEEAAVICGVQAGTMRARVSRGRALLAKAYGNQAPPAPNHATTP